MIVVTGAAGFIGSNLIHKLNEQNFNNIIAVDNFDNPKKNQLQNCSITSKLDRDLFFDWLDQNNEEVDFIFHLGARTDTAETDVDLLGKLNTNYSKVVWGKCCLYQIPLIYASSAATYGNGSQGFKDDEAEISNLASLNAYGWSKQNFDLWALEQKVKPFYWAGLKFFNVYGAKENHKGRMASVAYHAINKIKKTGKLKLFKSHKDEYKDGEQRRDFVYVDDVTKVMYWMMHHRKNSGIYNVGTGSGQTFNELAHAIFNELSKEVRIEYIDTPVDIRGSYQYFTEADISKLRAIGYSQKFMDIKKGIKHYVKLFDD